MAPATRALALAALTSVLLSAAAGASVFVWLPSSVSLDYAYPPVVIVNLPVESEEISSYLGANYTSSYILVKASSTPDTICNGNISAAVIVGSYVFPLCWYPVISDNLVPGVDNYSLDPGTYSAVFYNETGGAFDVHVLRGAWVQSFLYPGPGLGANDTAAYIVSFSYNAVVRTSSSLTYPLLIVYAAIYDANWNLIDAGTAGGYVNSGWVNVSFAYTPAALGMTGPQLYYLVIGFELYIIGSFDSVYLLLDNVSHRIVMQQGLTGFYVTWPIIYMVNSSVAGWTANITISNVENASEVRAWYMNPFGLPGSRYAVYYGPGITLPVEGASANLTGDLYGLGVVSVYGYGEAYQGRIEMQLSYSNGAAEVIYPFTLEYRDPPSPRSVGDAEPVWIRPVRAASPAWTNSVNAVGEAASELHSRLLLYRSAMPLPPAASPPFLRAAPWLGRVLLVSAEPAR